MVKFLLDENLPFSTASFLRDLGFDTLHIKEVEMLGASGDRIIGFARDEERTIITFDEHFADLVLYPPNTRWRIIRIRIHPPLLEDVTEALTLFFQRFDLSAMRGGRPDRIGKGRFQGSTDRVDLNIVEIMH